ncbi:thioredoxin-like protein [Kalaharituber pfeilii]|nr:thioredoxin-like protein [Kalaharituber pfeilii]
MAGSYSHVRVALPFIRGAYQHGVWGKGVGVMASLSRLRSSTVATPIGTRHPPSWVLQPRLLNTTPLLHTRGIHNLVGPSNPMPTERDVYAVEGDLDDVITLARETRNNQLAGPLHSVTRQQAAFVDSSNNSAFYSATTAVAVDPADIRKAAEVPSGEHEHYPQLKLNHRAPNFHALSSHGPIEFYEYIEAPMKSLRPEMVDADAKRRGHWVVFFSHPMDFTLACTTEIASIAEMQDKFEKRGAKLLGLSVGNAEDHREWMREVRRIIESKEREKGIVGKETSGEGGEATEATRSTAQRVSGGADAERDMMAMGKVQGAVGVLDEEKELGLEDVVGTGNLGVTEGAGQEGSKGDLLQFPIIADEDGFVARLYGMLDKGEELVDEKTGERKREPLPTVRSVFIIDPDKKIRMMTAYPVTTGRNMREILRVLDALVLVDERGVLTGEGWR